MIPRHIDQIIHDSLVAERKRLAAKLKKVTANNMDTCLKRYEHALEKVRPILLNPAKLREASPETRRLIHEAADLESAYKESIRRSTQDSEAEFSYRSEICAIDARLELIACRSMTV